MGFRRFWKVGPTLDHDSTVSGIKQGDTVFVIERSGPYDLKRCEPLELNSGSSGARLNKMIE